MDTWLISLAVGAIWGLGIVCLAQAIIRRNTAWFIVGQLAFCLAASLTRVV
jgi:hypothetical protein